MTNAVYNLLCDLDVATINRLNHGGSIEDENAAFDAVIQHPENDWTVELLAYRQRQVHFK